MVELKPGLLLDMRFSENELHVKKTEPKDEEKIPFVYLNPDLPETGN